MYNMFSREKRKLLSNSDANITISIMMSRKKKEAKYYSTR
jgi:hypothetical protein